MSSTQPDTSNTQATGSSTHVASRTSVESTLTVGASGMAGIGAPPPTTGRLSDLWRLVTINRKVGAGLVILAIFILIALFGPVFIHTDPNALNVGPNLASPSGQFLFGTTQTGQDVFAQTIVGARSSILWGFITGLLITAFSTAIGLIAGYFGGIVDDILSIFINIFLVIPGLPLAIVLAAFFPVKGDLTIALVLTVTSWSWNARVIRAQTMSMRSRDFVQAAQSSGENILHIIFAEILPNEIAIVMSGFIGTVIYAILAASGLQFLGLGDITSVSWGSMLYWVNNNDAILQGAYWWFLPPALCIAFVGTALTLINFGVDEFANPRLRNERKPKGEKIKNLVA
ncbi:ABC transporter permease [Ktedonobacter racemifer]|uniref:Binding-protein-dependent transport systems inner membrane component n=1 Tax=Ktedonobacter racemifer DSM 44963 TaxID=485913 RepID=D6U0N7_KTERA|nr:ABC transporter permease [Ktedonobacter racemifer]EFH82377.1 binding-protein-dependent transport systems inner membrane component [Ktedonobacter racemifer DSM 44963]